MKARATSAASPGVRVSRDVAPRPIPLREAGLNAKRTRARSRRSSRRWAIAALTTDTLMLSAAVVAGGMGSPIAGLPEPPLIASIGFCATVLALLAFHDWYRLPLRPKLTTDARTVISSTALAAMIISFVRIAVADDPHVAAQTAREWLFAATYLLMGRAALLSMEKRDRRDGDSASPTLILGSGKVGQLIAGRLLEKPEFGLAPIGFLDKEPLPPDQRSTDLPVLGASWDLEQVIADHEVSHVIAAFSTAPSDVLLRTVRRCQELGLSVSLVPRLFENTTDKMEIERIGAMPLLSVRPSDPKGWQFAVKYAFDRAVAAVVLLLLSPLLIAIALAIRLTMGGPVLFRQRRVGLDGHEFEMLKFRTMRPDTAPGPGVPLALVTNGNAPGGVEGDDRRTRLGALLRRASLDELPQLLNVLRGQMSLVGPRPERPEFVSRFGDEVRRYDDRHRCKSGITGWAQVQGLRGKTSIADRIEHDNYYIENWSLGLDFKILLMTAWAVFAQDAE